MYFSDFTGGIHTDLRILPVDFTGGILCEAFVDLRWIAGLSLGALLKMERITAYYRVLPRITRSVSPRLGAPRTPRFPGKSGGPAWGGRGVVR